MELRVRLKQHTPIIHFQHDQEGATLRATELKPKLDKYIKAKYNIDDKEKLRYQLKIRKISHGPGCVVPERFIRDSMFFGNMGIPPEKHKKEIFSENIELVFNTYFNNSLKNQIEETIPICLALENFGTRNNKGNGCFFIDAKSRSDFENILREALPGRVYYFDCTQNVFFSIKYFYSLLKSGINISTYYKSLIFIYFKEKGDITWDKKIIKNKFLPTVRADSYFTEKQLFIRGLLGVSDVQDWQSYGTQLQIRSEDNDIERVPSSLFFKIFNSNTTSRVYFWGKDYYKDILDKYFTFSMSNSSESLQIKTPMKFDMDKFLVWAVDYVNNRLKANDIAERGLPKRIDDVMRLLTRHKINKLL